MIDSYLPFIPIIFLYLFTFIYNKKKGRQLVLKDKLIANIFLFIWVIAGLWGGIAYVLDPNVMGKAISTNSYLYLYTTGRALGFLVITLTYTLFYHWLLKPNSSFIGQHKIIASEENDFLWIGYKVIFLTMAIITGLSGGYGFLTRTCWGLEQIKYISDTFMWWAELGWGVAGLVGIWAYFTYIRYWNGEDLLDNIKDSS